MYHFSHFDLLALSTNEASTRVSRCKAYSTAQFGHCTIKTSTTLLLIKLLLCSNNRWLSLKIVSIGYAAHQDQSIGKLYKLASDTIACIYLLWHRHNPSQCYSECTVPSSTKQSASLDWQRLHPTMITSVLTRCNTLLCLLGTSNKTACCDTAITHLNVTANAPFPLRQSKVPH
jgi:hypothetical protein